VASRQQQDSGDVTANNTLGQLAWIKDSAGEEHYGFDKRGRKFWNIRIINDDNSIAHHFYTGFAYDSMDRITQLSYPDQSTVSYQYNTRGLLESIPQIITQLDYNPTGQNLNLSYANGTSTNYTYDKRLRLSNISSIRNSDNLKLQDLNYSYDNVSNITAISDGRSNAELDKIGNEINLSTSEARKFNATQSFNYDNLYRLTEAKNTTVYGTIQYAYDQIGNMTTKTANLLTADQLMDLGAMSHGGSAGSQNRIGRSAGASPGPHAITGAQKGGGDGSKALSILYDDNGNVTSEREQSYQWDVKDRLVQMSKTDTVAQYRYDYGDIRKYKVVKNAENQISNQVFYIDKFSEVRNGELIKYLYAGTQRVARSKDSSATPQTFYLHDHLGSTNLALDSTAKVTEQLVNYPFGRNRLDASVSRQSDYRFTGKEKDSESGLQYFEARYFVGTGMFISVDRYYLDLHKQMKG
ncbi:MAG: hypothetical protein KAJ63_15875, partial [Methyloprofundus sp.]|nr:hypothetical protein [Methyloprofundus sp.]